MLIDTTALVALNGPRDQYHVRALATAESHLAEGGRYLGTTLILGELHSHVLCRRGPRAARDAIVDLLDDPAHEWLEVSASLVSDAVTRWLERFADQAFSLVDAVSFEVMRREKIERAFAFDHHFEVAGFELLR